MLENNGLVVDRLVKVGAFGAFCGMAATCWILWFDVGSIGTLLSSAQNTLPANLFFGSGILKGALLGGAFGLATLSGTLRAKEARLVVSDAAPSLSR